MDEPTDETDVPSLSEPSAQSRIPIYIFIFSFVILLASIIFLVQNNRKQIEEQTAKSDIIQPSITSSPTLTSTPIIYPTLSDFQLANWKTYRSSSQKFSLRHPEEIIPQERWECTEFSDVMDPRASSSAELKKNHTFFDICFIAEDMPSEIPEYRQNDYSEQKKITINGLSGYRKTITTYPDKQDTDIIYLENPVGGYVSIDLIAGNPYLLEEIISTFEFVDINKGKIKIKKGSVFFVQNGQEKVLADVNDSIEVENLRVELFTDAILSPDERKVLLFARAGINSELLFYTTVDSPSVEYIGLVSKAAWSGNNQYIAYIARIADAGGNYFIGVYDTNLNRNLTLTNKPNIKGIPNYSSVMWEQDDSGIKADYIAQSDIPYGETVGEGIVSIPLSSFALGETSE